MKAEVISFLSALTPIFILLCLLYAFIVIPCKRQGENTLQLLRRIIFSKRGFYFVLAIVTLNQIRGSNLKLNSPVSEWLIQVFLIFTISFILYSIWLLIKKFGLKKEIN